ncbi:uroporphyrinogen-III synthase [Wolinella succinogenes]|uniref:uroporphyrinogen-III synthase n=1 Tax=Wolinella succinogenes TaxID=844 RepID=UPI002FCB913F
MPKIYFIGSKPCEGLESLIVSSIIHLSPPLSLEGIDALILTSKNALIALDQITPEWKKIPAWVIGEACEGEVKKQGGIVAFVSSDGHGKGFFEEIKEPLRGKRVFYARAKHILSGVGEKLQKEGIEVQEAILYENRPILLEASLKPPKGSILIFTAPSAYDHFLMSFDWEESYEAIAIGKTTLAAFKEGVKAHLAPRVSLEACVQKAKELANRA